MPEQLRIQCTQLPKLEVTEGQDMRQALLQNSVRSVLVHEVCADRLVKVLKAVGVEPIPVKEYDSWQVFEIELMRGFR